MKRVLIVASVISFIEWFNKENVEYLQKRQNCEVHIACNLDYMSDTDEKRTLAYIDKLKSSGVILHNICFDRSPFGKNNISAYRSLRRLITTFYFDLIHCHTPTAALITRLAAIKTRKKGTVVMYTCHGFHFHNSAPFKNWVLYYPVELFFSRFCDYIVTINKEDYSRAKSFKAKNVRYIPGVGVNLEHFKSVVVDKKAYKRSIGIPDDCIMILSVGELIERKNHEVIIKALRLLKRDDIYYVICGKGPLREHLEHIACNNSVSERVLFLGFRNDIAELLHAADISAFPSKIEGLGLAGIEAMATGVPLISSNVHGILDYVKDGVTGYSCDPNDEVEFARAIELLAENPEMRARMSETCKKAVEPYELKNALKAMWDIYNEILK